MAPAAVQTKHSVSTKTGSAPFVDIGELAESIARFDVEAVQKLEAEMRRPSFRRAQMGFNNNIKFNDRLFHVQTEDSGLDQPHVITHLFADGGRVIKSHKRSYAPDVNKPNVSEK